MKTANVSRWFQGHEKSIPSYFPCIRQFLTRLIRLSCSRVILILLAQKRQGQPLQPSNLSSNDNLNNNTLQLPWTLSGRQCSNRPVPPVRDKFRGISREDDDLRPQHTLQDVYYPIIPNSSKKFFSKDDYDIGDNVQHGIQSTFNSSDAICDKPPPPLANNNTNDLLRMESMGNNLQFYDEDEDSSGGEEVLLARDIKAKEMASILEQN